MHVVPPHWSVDAPPELLLPTMGNPDAELLPTIGKPDDDEETEDVDEEEDAFDELLVACALVSLLELSSEDEAPAPPAESVVTAEPPAPPEPPMSKPAAVLA